MKLDYPGPVGFHSPQGIPEASIFQTSVHEAVLASVFRKSEARATFGWHAKGVGEAWALGAWGGGTSSRVGTKFPQSVWPSISLAHPSQC